MMSTKPTKQFEDFTQTSSNLSMHGGVNNISNDNQQQPELQQHQQEHDWSMTKISNCDNGCSTCIAFFVGILLTGFPFGCFNGMSAVIAAMRTLVRKDDWLKRWQSLDTSSYIIMGTVQKLKKTVNEINGFHTYSVTIEYDGSIVTDDIEVRHRWDVLRSRGNLHHQYRMFQLPFGWSEGTV